MSPLEHQAQAVDRDAPPSFRRNLAPGWLQHRALIEGALVTA